MQITIAMAFAHNPHGKQPEWKQNYYQVAAIDPGAKKNTGLRIQRRYLNGQIVQQVAVLIDFSAVIKEGGSVVVWLTKYLDQYLKYFMECHMILIEDQQIGVNSKALPIAQFLVTYFCLRLENSPMRPMIYEVSSKVKSQHLGVGYLKGKPPKGKGRTVVKKETRVMMKTLLRARNDETTLALVSNAARCQDLLDAEAMIEAFFLMQGLQTALTKDQLQWLQSVTAKTSTKVEEEV